jgi:hypothetical protein
MGKKGEFSEEEAREAGMTQEEMNQARQEQERELGNPHTDDDDD